MIQEWDLIQTNLHRLSQRRYETAIIPLGATECHNRHLPLGQDFLHTLWVARRCCELAWEQSPKVVCLPGIPFGVNCNLLDFPLVIHVSQRSLESMLRDIVESLVRHGIHKIVLLNGHGGNDFTAFIRETQCQVDAHLFQCHWWQVGMDRYGEFFDKPDDHAGIMETSIALALFPELVELQHAQSGATPPYRFEALAKKWVKTSRRFAQMNDHCAAGDPTGANAAAGQGYLDLICSRISQFLVELSESPRDACFPFARA